MCVNQIQRPMIANHCSHVHRTNGCAHHHPTSFCEHRLQASAAHQQANHNCGNCSHIGHHDCNSSSLVSKACPTNLHYHYPPEIMANRSSDASNNDSLLSTAHTHNLSNSSTTTHTSNVAVKHQPQFHRPILSRGARSNSSQHYEQYGPSSAASTSSATASLSNYQMPAGFEDLVPLYPTSKFHQPLPPPPIHQKSRPPSPSSQMMMLHNNNTISSNNNFNNNVSNNGQIMTTKSYLDSHTSHPQLNFSSNQALPPLPPKPISPNIVNSNPTQISTVRTSPTQQNQPVTRVTSQAGVQNPLPISDIPPPLPPLNPGSRTQPLVNSLMTRIQNITDSSIPTPPSNPIPNFINLNLSRNGMTSDAERKTEALTRQVEQELEQQQKSGEPLGVCSKCGDKVMIAQEACKAMNQIYHATCFVCCECSRTLLGKTFYPVGDKVYCEEDFKYTGHMQSLEKCAACSKPIFNMILPAMGKSYHPECFKCCTCNRCLDGVPFTIDMKNKIYCVEDYHNLYSPKCAACGKSISPIDGTGETVRVVSMDKDYHIDCYCCEDCGRQLTDEEPSQSYPLDNHLLCQRCHINRLSKMQAGLSLS